MSSTVPDVQKIVVSLSTPEVVIEPGSVAQLVVTMTNQQETPDRLSLEVEGVDVEWYAIPVPAVNVAPGTHASERILFKIARSSENRAGTYPFLVRVQAMETGEIGVAQATLVVKPFSALQVELNPKRAVATFFHPLQDFDVAVSNLGNVDETLDLYASDPEDGCAYEFDTDRITLKPGQSQVVPLAARPRTMTLLGGMRLYGFTVSARSVEDSYVSANAHGQIERHALISPLLGIFLLLLGFGGLGWWIFHPRPLPPVAINEFKVSDTHVKYGQDVTLTWDVSPYARQIILFKSGKNGVNVAVPPGEQRSPVNSLQDKPEYWPQTTYTLVVRGDGDKRNEVSRKVTVTVEPPPRPKPPRIEFFSADPSVVHQGEPVMLSWKASNSSEFILDPGSIRLSQYEQTHQVTPDQDTTYTLRALGQNEQTAPAHKTISVHVVSKDTPLAKITRFVASPETIYIGDRFRLRWKVRSARGIRITSDKGETIGTDLPASGSLEVPNPISDPTTYTLTATDSLGNPTTQAITVTPKPKPEPPPQPETPPSETPNGAAPAPDQGGQTGQPAPTTPTRP
ncbi:MAG TPA: hypothetical protein VFB38_15930 [Chthonomonadaceae bacterium]|nr:hypothetical protein [Chthonomonadaceae bacterium]